MIADSEQTARKKNMQRFGIKDIAIFVLSCTRLKFLVLQMTQTLKHSAALSRRICLDCIQPAAWREPRSTAYSHEIYQLSYQLNLDWYGVEVSIPFWCRLAFWAIHRIIIPIRPSMVFHLWLRLIPVSFDLSLEFSDSDIKFSTFNLCTTLEILYFQHVHDRLFDIKAHFSLDTG